MASVRKRTWNSGGEVKTAWVADYFDQNRKRHVKTFKTRKAADAWLVKTRNEVSDGTHNPERSSITVKTASELWLKKCEQRKLEWTSVRTYREHVDIYILPKMGNVKLVHLTPPRVEAFVDDLLETVSVATGAKLSVATARKVLTSLRGLVGEAQRRGLVAINNVNGVRIDVTKRAEPKIKKEVGIDIPTKEEVKRIIDVSEGQWRALFITAVFSGMRASELRALTWDNIDLTKNLIKVRQRADISGSIGKTKSTAGNRQIHMTPILLNTLRELKLANPPTEKNLVFPTKAGNVEYQNNIIQRNYDPAQIRAGVVDKQGNAKYNFHSLRHFYASWIIEQGLSPKEVTELLGHANIQISYNRYGHLFKINDHVLDKLAAGERAILGSV